VDANELRELIEIISRSNFSRFELERDDFKLKLVKADADPGTVPAIAVQAPVVAPAPAAPVAAAAPPAATKAAATESPAAEAPDESGFADMPSPIVGTFYRAPAPGSPPFVEIGDRVKKGQVLCIVEAMKLMNEIESEIDAEIVEIVAVNGQPVEYGEALFRLRPL
jgi:acetyl-CoA carboxylase biotin carboxyl carrier protein